YDTRFEVTMRLIHRELIMGMMARIRPQSLLDLYRQSDLVAIAQVGRSVVAGTDGEMRTKEIKTDLRISYQFKGEDNQQVIPFYYWHVADYPAQFNQGDRLLVLLRRRESGNGQRPDGYLATWWENSIKKLDDDAVAIYRQRIEELTAIFQRGDPDPAEIVDWLI